VRRTRSCTQAVRIGRSMAYVDPRTIRALANGLHPIVRKATHASLKRSREPGRVIGGSRKFRRLLVPKRNKNVFRRTKNSTLSDDHPFMQPPILS